MDFMLSVISGLEREHRFGTSRVHRSTLRAFISYVRRPGFLLRDLDRAVLKSFESHLRGRGCSWNTVSTYMRVLRAVYNRGVDAGLVPARVRQFSHVYTGTRSDSRRAFGVRELSFLFRAEISSHRLLRARDICKLMFYLRGIPFSDLAYLRRCDLRGDVLVYRRRKTGTCMEVRVCREARVLIRRYSAPADSGGWLFPFLTGSKGAREEYALYRRSLNAFNRDLRLLCRSLGLSGLSSYTLRHTWATTAYHCEIHPGIISQAMGHSSVRVTETYLKPFPGGRIEAANREVIRMVSRYK